MVAFERTTLKIPSATPKWDLDAWSYLPGASGTAPHPVNVMAHGFSATKSMSLASYAEAFAAAGYACLVFDYRHWGDSDGMPRHILDVKKQLEDYRTVIKYARQQSQFDPQRVIIWGTSFSGGHAITLASEPSLNAIAAISQCPYTGVTDVPKDLTFVKNAIYAILDLIKQTLGFQPIYIPAASGPGRVGGLTFPGSEEGLLSVCGNKDDWKNEISASSILEVPLYRPFTSAKTLSCPLLVIAPEDDNLCLVAGSKLVGEASEKAQVIVVPNCGHFEVYPGQAQGELSMVSQLDFLKKHVPV